MSNAQYEKRAKAWAQVQDIQARMDAAGYEPGAEDNETLERALNEVDTLSRAIELQERAKGMDGAFGQAGGTAAPVPTRAVEDPEAAHRSAFLAYLRGGETGLSGEQRSALAEYRAQATTPGADGGYLIPTDTLSKMTEALKAFGGILGVAEIANTSTGNNLNWPSNDDTANVGAILAENTQISEQALTFGQKTLGAYTYTSKLILVSWQLAQDNVFNLESFIARKAGERIGRAVSAHLATGTGSGQPQGLFTGASVGVTGAVSATAVLTYDNLIDLEHSVDPAYRNSGRCRWVMNDASVKLVRKIKDDMGQFIWQPSVQAGVPSTLFNYPITVDQGVAAPAVSAKSIGFGDVASAYVVRQVSGGHLVTMRERYADYLQNGYFAFLRLDAKVQDTGPFKLFQHGAAS